MILLNALINTHSAGPGAKMSFHTFSAGDHHGAWSVKTELFTPKITLPQMQSLTLTETPSHYVSEKILIVVMTAESLQRNMQHFTQ